MSAASSFLSVSERFTLDSHPRPKEIIFPEDRLYEVYKKRNPNWDKEVIKMHDKARAKGEKTRGYLFCNLWQQYILEVWLVQFFHFFTFLLFADYSYSSSRQAKLVLSAITNNFCPWCDRESRKRMLTQRSMRSSRSSKTRFSH
jgi:hypothetical protein